MSSNLHRNTRTNINPFSNFDTIFVYTWVRLNRNFMRSLIYTCSPSFRVCMWCVFLVICVRVFLLRNKKNPRICSEWSYSSMFTMNKDVIMCFVSEINRSSRLHSRHATNQVCEKAKEEERVLILSLSCGITWRRGAWRRRAAPRRPNLNRAPYRMVGTCSRARCKENRQGHVTTTALFHATLRTKSFILQIKITHIHTQRTAPPNSIADV